MFRITIWCCLGAETRCATRTWYQTYLLRDFYELLLSETVCVWNNSFSETNTVAYCVASKKVTTILINISCDFHPKNGFEYYASCKWCIVFWRQNNGYISGLITIHDVNVQAGIVRIDVLALKHIISNIISTKMLIFIS